MQLPAPPAKTLSPSLGEARYGEELAISGPMTFTAIVSYAYELPDVAPGLGAGICWASVRTTGARVAAATVATNGTKIGGSHTPKGKLCLMYV